MKRIFKNKSLAICVATAALMTIPLTASALDKLVVKDTGGVTKFVVNDARRVGAGTTAPIVSLHAASDSGTDLARGILSAQHNSGAQAAYVQFMKSRGTEVSPLAVYTGDFIGFFDTQVYSGPTNGYLNTAGFGFVVDGAVTSTTVPSAATFYTGTSVGAGRAERMRISSTGDVSINGLTGTGNGFACIDAGGVIFRSATACN